MEPLLRDALDKFFNDEFATPIENKLTEGLSLKSFKPNPIVLISLASGVLGDLTPTNIAKSLLFPRVLGTSITTTFGDKMQKLCVHHLGAEPASASGMDIEFSDKVSGGKVIAQMKAGPNTINKDDSVDIVEKMKHAYRLLQTNHGKTMPTFAMVITYGALTDVSQHYRAIEKAGVGAQSTIPLYVGNDFWHCITGDPAFYSELMSLIIELFSKKDHSKLLDYCVTNLAIEVEEKYFTNGKFDIQKV